MKRINITVIIPVYNAQKYIAKVIKSLLSQTYSQTYEIIIIDNFSTDNSSQIIESYPVKLLSESKRGSYHARNLGVLRAKGDIIAFTDADCVVEKDWLENIEKVMSNDTIKVVIGRQLYANTTALSLVEKYEDVKNSLILNSNFKELYYGHTNNMAVRRDIFEKVGLFPTVFRGGDTLFVHNVLNVFDCRAVMYCPEICVKHLEMNNLAVYYKKRYLYSYYRKLQKDSKVKSIPNHIRLYIVKKIAQTYKYSLAKSIFLLFILALGLMFWVLGAGVGQCKRLKMWICNSD